jgi:hypothetical protein
MTVSDPNHIMISLKHLFATLDGSTFLPHQRIYQDKKVQAHAKIVDVGERHLRM